MLRRQDRKPVLWRVLPGLTPFVEAMDAMNRHAALLVAGKAREEIWLLESPAGFSGGARAKPEDYVGTAGVNLEAAEGKNRGGSYNYHGPGVRGIVVLLDLKTRRRHVTGLVRALEDWIIAAVATFGIVAVRDERAGVVAPLPSGSFGKLAVMGFHMERWVSSYGLALYVNPDLQKFKGIVLCGEKKAQPTSLADLGVTATMAQVDAALLKAFVPIFGPVSLADGVLGAQS